MPRRDELSDSLLSGSRPTNDESASLVRVAPRSFRSDYGLMRMHELARFADTQPQRSPASSIGSEKERLVYGNSSPTDRRGHVVLAGEGLATLDEEAAP